jgi:hypothetical protein
MDYDVRLTESVERKIAEWPFPGYFKAEVLKAVSDELSSALPDAIGDRIAAPVRCVIYRMSMPPPGDVDDVSFTFWVNDTASEGARVIIDAAYREI